MYPDYETILLTIENKVAKVVINRPEVSNAFDDPVYADVKDVFERAGADPEVGAVMISGTGKNFSAGGDIADFRTRIDNQVYFPNSLLTLIGQMSSAIRRCPKPTIAMINGAAAGAGAGVALACDFRIFGDNSKLIFAFINLALTGDTSTMYYLSRMVGTAKAQELMMLGSILSAAEADKLGLATKVVPAAELEAASVKFAERLAHGPLAAYARQKEQINSFFYRDQDAWTQSEAKCMWDSSLSQDFNEAVNAFLEKRKPVFQGK